MEAIKGSDVNVPDAVFAWMLDGRGGVKPLENTDVIDEAHPCWLHLNYVPGIHAVEFADQGDYLQGR